MECLSWSFLPNENWGNCAPKWTLSQTILQRKHTGYFGMIYFALWKALEMWSFFVGVHFLLSLAFSLVLIYHILSYVFLKKRDLKRLDRLIFFNIVNGKYLQVNLSSCTTKHEVIIFLITTGYHCLPEELGGHFFEKKLYLLV